MPKVHITPSIAKMNSYDVTALRYRTSILFIHIHWLDFAILVLVIIPYRLRNTYMIEIFYMQGILFLLALHSSHYNWESLYWLWNIVRNYLRCNLFLDYIGNVTYY